MDNGQPTTEARRAPGKVQAQEREVTFITPVLFSGHIPSSIVSRTLSYRKEDLLEADQTVLPAIIDSLPLGMVIELPEEAINQYVASSLSWLPLSDDNYLAQKLLSLIKSTGGLTAKNYHSAKGIDILSSALFLNADRETQHRIQTFMSGLKPEVIYKLQILNSTLPNCH